LYTVDVKTPESTFSSPFKEITKPLNQDDLAHISIVPMRRGRPKDLNIPNHSSGISWKTDDFSELSSRNSLVGEELAENSAFTADPFAAIDSFQQVLLPPAKPPRLNRGRSNDKREPDLMAKAGRLNH
jgi:hypothetical protein